MGIQIPYTERVLAALTALVIAINDANDEVAEMPPVELKGVDALLAESDRIDKLQKLTDASAAIVYEKSGIKVNPDMVEAWANTERLQQTSLKQFDDTQPFEVAPWNNRQYRCSNCGMYGHTMANKNRPCKGGEY